MLQIVAARAHVSEVLMSRHAIAQTLSASGAAVVMLAASLVSAAPAVSAPSTEIAPAAGSSGPVKAWVSQADVGTSGTAILGRNTGTLDGYVYALTSRRSPTWAMVLSRSQGGRADWEDVAMWDAVPGQEHSGQAALTVRPDGRVHVAWVEIGPDKERIYSGTWRPQSGSTFAELARASIGALSNLNLVSTADGRSVMVYTETFDDCQDAFCDTSRISVQSWTVERGWDNPDTLASRGINQGIRGLVGDSQAGVDGSGRLFIGWRSWYEGTPDTGRVTAAVELAGQFTSAALPPVVDSRVWELATDPRPTGGAAVALHSSENDQYAIELYTWADTDNWTRSAFRNTEVLSELTLSLADGVAAVGYVWGLAPRVLQLSAFTVRNDQISDLVTDVMQIGGSAVPGFMLASTWDRDSGKAYLAVAGRNEADPEAGHVLTVVGEDRAGTPWRELKVAAKTEILGILPSLLPLGSGDISALWLENAGGDYQARAARYAIPDPLPVVGAPTAVQAQNKSDVDVAWIVPGRNPDALPVTRWRVEAVPPADSEEQTTRRCTVAAPANSCTVPSIYPNTVYGIAVTAEADTGDELVPTMVGDPSAAAAYSWTSVPLPAPTGLRVTVRDVPGEVDVFWDPVVPGPGEPEVSSYAAFTTDRVFGCQVAAPATACRIVGLNPASVYRVQAFTLNSDGYPGPVSEPSAPFIADPDAPPLQSLVIVGTRSTVKGKPGIEFSGAAVGLPEGSAVVPYLKFPGQASYEAGKARPKVTAEGVFAWARKSGKKVYVYFKPESNPNIKSNMVVLPSNKDWKANR